MPSGHPDWRPPRPSAAAVIRLVGADPAAGVQWSFTVTAGQLWRPVGIFAQLVTSATVANRGVYLRLRRGAGIMFDVPMSAVQAASLTCEYQWYRGAGGAWVNGLTATNNGAMAASMPDLILQPSDVLESQVHLFQVGDNWGSPILVYERVA